VDPRPQAAKRTRVSFGPELDVVTEPPITKGRSTTGHQGGGWGGHWPTRTEMTQLTTGKGKEAMEDPVDLQLIPDVYQPAPKRHAGPHHTGDSCHNLGGGNGISGAAFSDRLLPQRAQEPIDHDMQTKNSPSNRNPFGKPRPPRPKKKPPVRDKISHHQRRDAARQGTRPSAQSKR